MENVNILSLIISTLLPMIIGFIYYSKPLFGNAWMASLGFTEEDLKEGNMVTTLIVSLVLSLLLTFFLFANVNGPGQDAAAFDTFKHGAAHGGFVSLFVAIPVLITNGLFEKKNWKNLLINSFYWIITIVLMSGILDAMNHIPADAFEH